MQKKDHTFVKFCEYKAHVEKDIGRKFKALKSDNNGECVSNHFKKFCASESIQRDIIAPRNPQENRVAERKN